MGWWKIEPETGMPLKKSYSALSKPPDRMLLNAVPGVDDDEQACYLGDGPWDMASTVPAAVAEVIGAELTLSDEQLRDLLLKRTVPPHVASRDAEIATHLLQVVDEFWEDIDSCYEDDWERPAQPAEKRWVCEYVIENRRTLN